MDNANFESYLARQRWFSGKGRGGRITGVQALPWLTDVPPRVRIELVTVAYPGVGDDETETYQLPLVYRSDPVDLLAHALLGEDVDEHGSRSWVYDALHDKDVTGLWTHGIAQNRRADDGERGVVFHREAATTAEFALDQPSLLVGVEQSNTSLVFGEAIILKVLRKVAPGLNPDIELHSALANAGSQHIAPPLGWVEGRWVDPASGEVVTGSLAILQEFLQNSTEGWEMAKTSVRDLLAEGDLHADEVGGDFAGESFRLGLATAEVHRDLARVLPTATLDRAGVRSLAASMRRRLDAAVDEVLTLSPYAEVLRAVFDDLAALDEPLAVQRVHGDFHLAQVMRTIDGWKLLDFEGEPAKPLIERRALESPLKDVAGMLRSFDYAAHQFLAIGGSDNQRDYRASEWAERNRNAFCDGYARGSGSDPRAAQGGAATVLCAFEADKAIYEVMYEARNRPAWLQIPLGGIARLVAARITDIRQLDPSHPPRKP